MSIFIAQFWCKTFQITQQSLKCLPYYRKLTLHEIKVLEINANLMENDFRIKKINAKEEVEFHKKEINAIMRRLVVTAGNKFNKYCKPSP